MVVRFSPRYIVLPFAPQPTQLHSTFGGGSITLYETVLTTNTDTLNIRIVVKHSLINPLVHSFFANSMHSYLLCVSSHDDTHRREYTFNSLDRLDETMRQLGLPDLTENTVCTVIRAHNETGTEIGYTHAENFARLFRICIRYSF